MVIKMKIRVAGIVKNSIVDGPGIRYVVFAQGCRFKCKGCHNSHTHDKLGGLSVDVQQIAAEIKSDPLLDGVTFSGGEPFEQAVVFANLAALISELGLNIICYTGYTFEELYENPDMHMLLNKVDVLVDGRFELNRKNPRLKFRGSDNQRVIDVKESFKCEKAVEINW
ncbi:MAG: anaerobic ribonucleoside-triphosphate reductase activating protein [Oscillospiraceae bacterium]|nr:anaerobic ribonucleoside-triphosphate reductase activating protein [Oscillospiraceae bacterium]